MRKRPNYNGIEKIYTIQNSCTDCNKPFFQGDEYIAELDLEVILCEKCMDSDNHPEMGEWVADSYKKGYQYILATNKEDLERALNTKIN